MDLFRSKKFKAAIVGLVVVVVGHFVPAFADAAGKIVMLLMTYIGAQGVADLGKEKAKIEVEE